MLTVPEAARRARLSPETIRRWIRAGKLASQKVGTQHLVDERDVDALSGRARRVAAAAAAYVAEPLAAAEIPERLRRRIVSDARILGGKPIVRGTRISVELALGWLAAGWSIPDVVDSYPTLSVDDVRACLAYAADRVRGEEVLPA